VEVPPRGHRWLVRAAAVGLAVTAALLLASLVHTGEPGSPARMSYAETFLRALAITAVLQVGLFWAPDARGWQRLLAAALMLPSVLLFGGMAGEAVMKVVRGYPLRPAAAALSVAALVIYVWQFWSLAQRSGAAERRDAKEL